MYVTFEISKTYTVTLGSAPQLTKSVLCLLPGSRTTTDQNHQSIQSTENCFCKCCAKTFYKNTEATLPSLFELQLKINLIDYWLVDGKILHNFIYLPDSDQSTKLALVGEPVKAFNLPDSFLT